MAFITQTPARPTQIRFALNDLASGDVTRLRIAVAYATYGGCSTLVPELGGRLGDAKWRALPKQLIVSFDFGVTEPQALQYMQAVPSMDIRIANLQGADLPTPNGATSFHPKLYVFDKDDRRDYLCGSPNLTGRALTVNTEAALVVAGAPAEEVDQHWDAMWAAAFPLTAELLGGYEEARTHLPRYEPDPPVPVPHIPRAVALQPFGDAVASGALDPEAFDAFWVEAGSMSSGGSHNQLELPRAANRFFRQRFDNYESAAVERIADLELTASGRRWSGRPLTWHGDNRMERLNLPTIAQGGFTYPKTAILFRRAAGTYELEVADWNGPTAIAWRTASQQTGRLYRAGGAASPRICGLF